jgi:hypothetical protein
MVERLQQLWGDCEVTRIRPRKPFEGIERPQRYALSSLEEHRQAFLRAMHIDEADHSWPVTDADR